ncbi:protein EARLY STARVATION 1, chloroplastic-like isoform X2 [Tasmannia lanceolata]|uniref:protein EARLY STARVATION 1, chloroplastic-like isoform X2 n=1 Tax=Tasmannia lanceolata TaxID=3420 RepID=UPI0040627F24
MEASSKSLSAPFHLKLQNSSAFPLRPGIAFRRRRKWSRGGDGNGWNGISCCCSDTEFRNLIQTDPFKRGEESRSSSSHVRAMPPQSFASPRPRNVSKQVEFYPRCSPRYSAPQSRDTPPKRDTGIASEKDWGINWLNEMVNESGANEDGSTWHRESGEDLGDNGYRCRWARMGGQCHDGSSEWKETWWEKSDWTGYKELGVEKSGKNAEGDSWWETWKEVFHQDEWSNLTRIERSAQKQAKGGSESAGWYEEWWEKYDARGWTEKGAHKYGRLNEQSWWEQWGEHYDGRGSVLKWTDKWAETKIGSKWGDKWEEKFFAGIGSRHGETWHASSTGDRKYTNMVGAQQEKVGILLSMRKHIMKLNLIMDGQMLWAIQASCYQSSQGRGFLVFTQILILGHLHQRQMTCRNRSWIRHRRHRHNEELLRLFSFFF